MRPSEESPAARRNSRRSKVRRIRRSTCLLLGETLDGRLGFVIYTRFPDGRIRVITARHMEHHERRQYRRQ